MISIASMAIGLKGKWLKLKLMADKEIIVVAEDEEDTERNEYIALCLLDRLYMDSSFNS